MEDDGAAEVVERAPVEVGRPGGEGDGRAAGDVGDVGGGVVGGFVEGGGEAGGVGVDAGGVYEDAEGRGRVVGHGGGGEGVVAVVRGVWEGLWSRWSGNAKRVL